MKACVVPFQGLCFLTASIWLSFRRACHSHFSSGGFRYKTFELFSNVFLLLRRNPVFRRNLSPPPVPAMFSSSINLLFAKPFRRVQRGLISRGEAWGRKIYINIGTLLFQLIKFARNRRTSALLGAAPLRRLSTASLSRNHQI